MPNINTMNKFQIKLGTLVEFEHTTNKKEALVIAAQHIEEDPDYYTKLYTAGLIDEPKAINFIKNQSKLESAKMKINRILSEELSNYLIEFEMNKSSIKFDKVKRAYKDEVLKLSESERQQIQQFIGLGRLKVKRFVDDFEFYYDQSDAEVESLLDAYFRKISPELV